MERAEQAQVREVVERRPDGTARRFATMGQQVIDFIHDFCVFTDGEWIGKPATLQNWQKRLLLEMFEVERQPDDTWKRRYRRALIGIPKKNGKSQLAAWLAVYFLLWDDEPSAMVVAGANSDEQADIVFDAAKKTCELSPELAALTDRGAKMILAPSMPGSRLVRVANSVGSNDGKNIHAAVLDEVHEMVGPKGRAFHTVITNGVGARRQPFLVHITTAGVETDAVWYEMYEKGRRMEAGDPAAQDHRFFFRWWEAPKDLDYRSEEAWRAANPSYGVTVFREYFEDQLNSKLEYEFRRYNLNQHTEVRARWLPEGAWEACNIGPFEFDRAAPTWVAIDASTDNDSTAVLVGQWHGGQARVKARIWERPLGPNGRPVEGWQVPHAEIENYAVELFERYRLQAVPFDAAFITWLAQSLAARGLPMEKYPQSNTRMIGPTKATTELILSGRLGHDGDPRFARHVKNAIARQVSGGGIRLTKTIARSEDAVRYANDAAVSLVMLIGAMGEPPEPAAAEPRIILLDEMGV